MSRFASSMVLASLCLGGCGSVGAGVDVGADAGLIVTDDGHRLVVLPVLFVPTDATLSADEAQAAHDLLVTHLKLAQLRYRTLLHADSFFFRIEESAVYRAKLAAIQYDRASSGSADAMARELLDSRSEDRNHSRHVFVALFVRPAGQPCGPSGPSCMGGGIPFNGRQGTGGGFVQLEFPSLTSDAVYPFQSTLIHELGHAFGLTHSECYGESQTNGQSIMSYNPVHHSKGTTESPTPGVFLPEEYFLLGQQKLGFPLFAFTEAEFNPTGRALVGVAGDCEFGAMGAALGPMDRLGYQLFFDTKLVSDPSAQFYTLGDSKRNCTFNVQNNGPTHAVSCLFDGVRIGGN